MNLACKAYAKVYVKRNEIRKPTYPSWLSINSNDAADGWLIAAAGENVEAAPPKAALVVVEQWTSSSKGAEPLHGLPIVAEGIDEDAAASLIGNSWLIAHGAHETYWFLTSTATYWWSLFRQYFFYL